MALLLGLAAAISYGAADFFGGDASRRSDVFGVVFISQLIGSGLFFATLPLFTQEDPTARAFIWGGLAGVAGGGGVLFFYHALSVGRMSIIAPITGVEAAAIPVLWGLAGGERPSTLALAGVGLALVAVAFVSMSPEPGAPSGPRVPVRGLTPASLAGLGFGLFFIFLAEAGENSGLWPLVGGRLASMTLLGVALLAARRPLKPSPGSMPFIAGAGVFDVSANVFYLLATRQGLLSLVAVLTSMYPAVTVLLARLLLDERLVKVQVLGLTVAALGVVLIGLG